MYRFISCFTTIILFSFNSFACLNGETKVLKNGLHIYEDHQGIVPYGHVFYQIDYEKVISELKSKYNKTHDIDYLSDVGYVLTIQKKYKEALNLYFEIEKIEPNRYSTSSNLGTIYELIGDNTNALKWIKNSVKINRKSHNESEWLHIKILEAKINKTRNLSSEYLVNTSFGDSVVPSSNYSKIQREKLIKALYYQLNERITFIKPKDEVIGKLLFELGNLALLKNDYSSAIEIYKKAFEYGNPDPLIFLRTELAREKNEERVWEESVETEGKLIAQNQKKSDFKNKFLYQKEITVFWKYTAVISIVVIVILLFIIYRLKRKK